MSDGFTGETTGVGTPGFTNGGFETGDLTGWSSAGNAGVIGQFDYNPEYSDGPPPGVPVPAAVWLLGSGLLGLLGLRKKSRR
ncbi:MAG: PEP-CTERM sorting domain-containing protein, partial [Thermodesulfobacteriota bacterium]|nr:PEP-CTERM sorting domain-containing protein [Thermodesulfobacteriota bacterium]